MIEILINEIQGKIEIKGHANSDEYGKDLVCAGVSSIACGIVSVFTNVAKREKKIKEKDKSQFVTKITCKSGLVKIKYDPENFTNIIYVRNFIIPMFEQFENSNYSEYVTLKLIEKKSGKFENKY